jgi:hypothetical protein
MHQVAVSEANDEEVAELTKINEFLKGHRWACKGPVRLLYKGDPFNEGRTVYAIPEPSRPPSQSQDQYVN